MNLPVGTSWESQFLRNPGLRQLRDAWACARELEREHWQLAVEVEALMTAGLTRTDIRWLLACGLAEHATELTRPSDAERRFERVKSLALGPNDCVVLTPAGFEFLESNERLARLAKPVAGGVGSAPPAATVPILPHWDGQLHELSYDNEIIKRFTHPAPSQELILEVFEEDGWPQAIDDPLPMTRNQDPKRRLHYTVQNLNRAQNPSRLHFFINGNGQSIRWRVLEKRVDENSLKRAGDTSATRRQR